MIVILASVASLAHLWFASHDRTGLTLDALKLLKAYQRLDIEAIAALRLTAAVERESEAALRDFVRTALERDARSLAFLDEVRTTP